TTYAYDELDRLIGVNQYGGRLRAFKYDSLGRLTGQRLTEQDATISDGTTAWSETFAYDSRGNIIQRTDARGVKTNFSYSIGGNIDPLNRLQSISYDTFGADQTYPISSAPNVTFSYMTTG